MASEALDGAAVSMAPPARPHHRSISSIAQAPDSPARADTFKRMSTTSIATPISESSTRPNSMTTAYTEEPSEVSSPISRKSLTIETNPYLTAVAAQERRVLELREELQKAETDLQTLKKNWTQQEATRKRQEIRQNAEAMRPLTSPIKSPSMGTPTAESFRQSMDEERKRALYARPRIPERRVFEGRHTRTLSLLSPGALANRDSVSATRETGAQTPKTATLSPTDSNSDGTTDGATVAGRPRADTKGARDDMINTGKQLVGDIREGLWSFWDDLRQATVGEEALKEPPNRRPSHQGKSPSRLSTVPNLSRKSSSSTLQQPPSRRTSRSPHARSNTVAGISAIGSKTPARSTAKARHLETTAGGDILRTEDDDGGWSNWDSPIAKTVASSAHGVNSQSSTPRTSVSSNESISKSRNGMQAKGKGKSTLEATSERELMGVSSDTSGKDALPWPTLKKFRPGSLQRTASHLMKEWERSLTPPAEDTEKDWIDRYIDGPRRPGVKDQAKETA